MAWNDESEALLAKLWTDGLSASQIASRIGGVTRNAVIGKRIRMGLPDRGTRNTQRTRKSTAGRRTQPQRKRHLVFGKHYVPGAQVEEFRAQPDLVIPESERKSLLDLTETSCRWPIGDPKEPDFHFCNRSKVEGKSYCAFHCARAYDGVPVRRRAPLMGEAPAQPVRVSADAEAA